MMWEITIADLGIRYLEAPSALKALRNAKRIWPTNTILRVERWEATE